MATLTSMAGGGTAAWATNTKAVAPLAAQGIALTGVVAANAAGAVVTGSPQGATSVGSVGGYAAGQAPGALGTWLGPLVQELFTYWATPPKAGAEQPARLKGAP